MLSPHLQPYSKPRPERARREPKPPREDNLTDGLWFALFIALVIAAVGGLIIWGIKVLMGIAVIMFFAWCLRWAIRIW